jgi:putative ABC transport system substrate-binding protein
MRRREFITLLGGAAAWPLAARAQQSQRIRRIGVFANLPEDDPESRLNMAAFAQGLAGLGWIVGRNVQIDYRWAEGDADRVRTAAELVALVSDVILAHGSVEFIRRFLIHVLPAGFHRIRYYGMLNSSNVRPQRGKGFREK